MSFGLKNTGTTYQRAILLYFADQLHRNVEAYVDDVVVKTMSQDQFITDLEETFNSLRKFRWKLNPTKCVFGVPSGKLLGFIVSNRGIEANPEKINAIMAMDALATIKDVQKLTGCMAALNRFLSRLGEWGLPFFKFLKRQIVRIIHKYLSLKGHETDAAVKPEVFIASTHLLLPSEDEVFMDGYIIQTYLF